MAKITKKLPCSITHKANQGKISSATKPYSTQTDLSLAYSPGVCRTVPRNQKEPAGRI